MKRNELMLSLILSKQDQILHKIETLELRMASLEENTALVAEIAAQVEANNSLIGSIAAITEKVFVEVEKLVAAANVEIPGLAELKLATISQAELLMNAAAKNTDVDNLIPDEPVPAAE